MKKWRGFSDVQDTESKVRQSIKMASHCLGPNT